MKARFDRQEYLAFEEIFEVGQLDDVTKELCEFSDDIEDMAYELAYTRYALAKCEARNNALVEAVAWEMAADRVERKAKGASRPSYDELAWASDNLTKARAEVDRLLQEASNDGHS